MSESIDAQIDRSDLGDMPADEFRTALHRVADWVADYREGIANLPISPNLMPGEITCSPAADAARRSRPARRNLPRL
jgi:aromatic-L-amino-acid decarboxylase